MAVGVEHRMQAGAASTVTGAKPSRVRLAGSNETRRLRCCMPPNFAARPPLCARSGLSVGAHRHAVAGRGLGCSWPLHKLALGVKRLPAATGWQRGRGRDER